VFDSAEAAQQAIEPDAMNLSARRTYAAQVMMERCARKLAA
jgi:hypothetical protein